MDRQDLEEISSKRTKEHIPDIHPSNDHDEAQDSQDDDLPKEEKELRT